jgi:feruloyl esterase
MADGVADRVIEDPRMCRPRDVVDAAACRPGSAGEECLAPSESALALDAYSGPADGGVSVFPGLAPGSESGWGTLLGREPLSVAEQFYRFFVHKDPEWDYRTLDLATDVGLAERVVGDAMDAYDADISGFLANGGKLLLYHGWADPGISPYNTVNYHDAVVRGNASAGDSVRLFMMPGVGHCSGGEGPSSFDALGVIDDWVTSGDAPGRIVASRVRDGEVDRTRPLCAYPGVAVYNGSGSTDEASSFTCR